MADRTKLANVAPVLVARDVRSTAAFYRKVFGFTVVEHYDATEPFAAIYRDDVEIILVQARHGSVESNRARYGSGYDVYIDPETVEGVDEMYAELAAKGAVIRGKPAITPYGSYEFIVEDVDGRLIGNGRIRDESRFFRDAG